MTKWICTFFIACFTTLFGAENLQISTQSFHDIYFQFQMPSAPEEQEIGDCHYWTSETNHQSFTVGVTARSDGESDQLLKVREITPLIKSKRNEGYHLQESLTGDQDQYHMTLAHPSGKLFLCSFFLKDNTIFALMTETENASDHQSFLESFSFIETPKPPCCECCKEKGTRCTP